MTRQIRDPARARGLSERHRQFVEAYMGAAAGNGAKAAKLAGYAGTAKVRSETARKILARKDVQQAMRERVASDPAVADREARQAFWSRVMRGEELVPVVSHGKVKAKVPPTMADRLKASALLGRSQGDFVDVVKHEHAGEVVIVHATELPARDPPPDPGSDA